jgi:hypothetical protein
VEGKKGAFTRYTVENKLLYYRTDEYESWRLCIPDISYRNTIIHENHDLPIAGHPGFVQTYIQQDRTLVLLARNEQRNPEALQGMRRMSEDESLKSTTYRRITTLAHSSMTMAINRNGLPRISIIVNERQPYDIPRRRPLDKDGALYPNNN